MTVGSCRLSLVATTTFGLFRHARYSGHFIYQQGTNAVKPMMLVDAREDMDKHDGLCGDGGGGSVSCGGVRIG